MFRTKEDLNHGPTKMIQPFLKTNQMKIINSETQNVYKEAPPITNTTDWNITKEQSEASSNRQKENKNHT